MGPEDTSSDILGIEVGHHAVRGVRLNQETSELIAAAECRLPDQAISFDGIIEPGLVGPPLDQLIGRLGVTDRSTVRVGLTLGPRNAGVGSGPAMAGWLETQAVNLQEPMTCAGQLGVAFLPSRAVDAAAKLAQGSGFELSRIDLAPVAAARAIGDQVDDLICVGSGRGWQARMRDFEVLEAMENEAINGDQPLVLVAADGMTTSIQRYGWVEISEELDRSHRLEIGQLAAAVGVAIGVAYESPANLLSGSTIACAPLHPESDPSLAHLAGYELEGDGAEATLRLNSRAEPSESDSGSGSASGSESAAAELGSASAGGRAAARTPRESPSTSLSPIKATKRRTGGAATVERSSARASRDSWGDTIEESDPIRMFSPENEADEMLGKRRVNLDLLFGLLLLSAIGLLLAYVFL